MQVILCASHCQVIFVNCAEQFQMNVENKLWTGQSNCDGWMQARTYNILPL